MINALFSSVSEAFVAELFKSAKFVFYLLITFAVLYGVKPYLPENEWHMFFFSNKYDRSTFIMTGTYESLGKCREAADRYIFSDNWTGNSDYECKRNCKYDDFNRIYVCEDTH